MLGYIMSGLYDILTSASTPHFTDRSPTNVFEWNILWKLMGRYVQDYGNTNPSTKSDNEKKVVAILNDVRECYFYKTWRQQFNCVVLINSNIDSVDMIRLKRNENSDGERSQWRFYTYYQNLMYKTLYPNQYIDLAWFDGYKNDQIIDGIVKYLEYALDRIEYKESKLLVQMMQQPVRMPTMEDTSFLTLNYNAHAFRQMGRIKTKNITEKHDSLQYCNQVTNALPMFVSFNDCPFNIKNCIMTEDKTKQFINSIMK